MAKQKAIKPMEPDLMELAEAAYLAYFVSKQGDAPAPDFDRMMEQSKTAWVEAASAVKEAIAAFNILKAEPIETAPASLEDFEDFEEST